MTPEKFRKQMETHMGMCVLIEQQPESEAGKEAIAYMRHMLQGASEAAPPEDLAKFGRFMFDLRMQASQQEIQNN